LAQYDKASLNYRLEFPNLEVETALNQQLLLFITNASAECVDYAAKELPALLEKRDIAGAVLSLQNLFASVPYHWTFDKSWTG
jgi:hypothetical protein